MDVDGDGAETDSVRAQLGQPEGIAEWPVRLVEQLRHVAHCLEVALLGRRNFGQILVIQIAVNLLSFLNNFWGINLVEANRRIVVVIC